MLRQVRSQVINHVMAESHETRLRFASIADFEKQKEVKSFVATGQPLMAQYVIDATHAARAKHQADRERDERTVARARTSAVREGERVRVSEPVANLAFEASPAFSALMKLRLS